MFKVCGGFVYRIYILLLNGMLLEGQPEFYISLSSLYQLASLLTYGYYKTIIKTNNYLYFSENLYFSLNLFKRVTLLLIKKYEIVEV